MIDRSSLPETLPAEWRYWASYDWGYGHYAVMGAWCTTSDGVDILLDSVWLRKTQDDDQATEFLRDLPHQCLREVYSGHDVRAKVTAHAASGESVQDIFAKRRILCVLADIDKVNGGRAVNRQLKNGTVKIVRTPANLKGYDQLETIMPDELDVRKPAKIDCDEHGEGGDDFADMFRYGLATRISVRHRKQPFGEKTPDRATPLKVEDGKVVSAPKQPKTLAELADWAESRASQHRLPVREKERLPRRVYK